MTPKTVVDGEQFSLWTQGYLVFRTPKKAIIIREDECELAMAALERGETIYLTERGRIGSTLRLVDGKYIQENLPDENYVSNAG